MAKTKIDISDIRSIPGKQTVSPTKPTEVALTVTSRDPQRPFEGKLPSISVQPNQPIGSLNINSTLSPMESEVEAFGAKSANLANYPNDIVRLDLFNANTDYLGTTFRIGDYKLKRTTDGQSVILNIEENIQNLGYFSGRYSAIYRFHRNILGSGDINSHKLVIQEISYNGLEVRVRPVLSTVLDNTSFVDQFQNGIFSTKKSQLLTNLFLFKSQLSAPATAVPVFDYIQDKFTIQQSPYSIIFKLSSPVPSDFVVGDQLWLAQQISDDVRGDATLVPPNLSPPTKQIAGPNFDVLSRNGTGISTEYKDREDLLTTNTEVQYKIQDKVTSSSLVEGINLNQDFRLFENFITYSSAEARLQGFFYKLKQIEAYDARIAALTTDLNGLPSSSVTGSTLFTNNINTTRNRRSAVIGGFDAYERYLYYESASYESSSYGEFWPTTWPKSTNTKPYVNAPTTSSLGENWFAGAIESASLYDADNLKSLTRNTPAHIIEDPNNENYITLLTLVGHYFDNTLPYIQQITTQYNKEQSISAGLAKDMLFVIGQSLGFEFEDGSTLDDLWNYALGVNETGSVNTAYETTTENTTKEIWKRIINNYPYLLKTKGTERGLRALINCFGIPDTILRIREYGGHEASFEKKSDYVFNRFYYALTVGYNGQTSGNPNQSVKIPWQAVSQSGFFPETVELRVRMAKNQTKDQTIFEVPNQWRVRAFVSGGYNYLGFFLSGSAGWATASVSSSIYDGGWHSLALRRENSTDTVTDNQVYSLIAKRTNYLNVVITETASLSINGSTSSSYNSRFLKSGSLWIPGSGSFTIAQSHSMNVFSGSVQEFRYWGAALDNDILDNHALTPTSFQGNTDGVTTGSTSSYSTLSYRLSLGSDSKKTLNDYYPATSSFDSQHPDYTRPMPSASFFNITSSAYVGVAEENSVEWPDLGANRSISNKVRIDNTVLAGTQLFKDTKAEKPLTDNYPPDSPRLGVFLSPSNEINQNIAEQFGGLSIDNLIGDPAYLELDNYPALAQLQREYAKKYKEPNKPNQYIRFLKHYNAALFQLIKKFAPYRANLQTGLVIEPLLIERSKFGIKLPKVEDLVLTGSLDVSVEKTFPPTGKVEDPVNKPEPNYVPEATIGGDESDYITLEGSPQQITPLNDDAIEYLTLVGNYFINPQGALQVMQEEFNGGANIAQVAGTIDMGVNGAGWNSRYLGSRYVYMTYASSGSDPRTLTYTTASRYDEYEAIQPSIITNTYSTQFAPGGSIYDRDIYGGRAFTGRLAFTQSVILSSSIGLNTSLWTSQYGLRIQSSYTGSTATSSLNTAFFWRIDSTNGLHFHAVSSRPFITGSALLDAFFYRSTDPYSEHYLYEVTVDVDRGNSVSNPGIILYFGSLTSAYSQSITPTTTSTRYKYITKADGPWLGIVAQASSMSGGQTNNIAIQNVSVRALNYRAQVQDYHLLSSRGMVNARYEGCKMTSTDYNVDSLDTVDGGPVITVTLVGGTVLSASPSTQPGTFKIQ